jgi:uncharacterized repeat protein (TIGR03803 family)
VTKLNSWNMLASASAFRAVTLALLSALLFIAALPAQAQTEITLYSFTGGSDGGDPGYTVTADDAGNFYGTTFGGGLGQGFSGHGTVFELSPNGVGGWNETVLYTFTGGADGGQPAYSGLIFDRAGNLYGTACCGGANGHGVVFELSPLGNSWTETVLYSFADGTDGASPFGNLIMDTAGNLYGTTLEGGIGEHGIVFELSPSGGAWTEQVISDVSPTYFGGLTLGVSGRIFGSIMEGSKVGKLTPDGANGWRPGLIHTFAGSPNDGSDAQGTIVLDTAGNIYGTTSNGGAENYGTVYKLSPEKNGKWTEKILYSFEGGTDGSSPAAGVVLDAAGNIYGVTENGGQYGLGTVFALAAPVGSGSYKEKILWSFNGADGQEPYYPMILDGGNLYGTLPFGGASGWGAVFEVTR